LHASLILISYHSLCGLIFGQGLKEEIDLPLNYDIHSKIVVEEQPKEEGQLDLTDALLTSDDEFFTYS
jgi:hypothetical protein